MEITSESGTYRVLGMLHNQDYITRLIYKSAHASFKKVHKIVYDSNKERYLLDGAMLSENQTQKLIKHQKEREQLSDKIELLIEVSITEILSDKLSDLLMQ